MLVQTPFKSHQVRKGLILGCTGFWRVRKIQEILGLGATLWRRELSF